MSTDLVSRWIKECLDAAKADHIRTEVAYCALKDKKTKYAQAIKRLAEAKRKVVQVWSET